MSALTEEVPGMKSASAEGASGRAGSPRSCSRRCAIRRGARGVDDVDSRPPASRSPTRRTRSSTRTGSTPRTGTTPTNFIYKVAGSDGCLPTATDCSTGGGTPGDSNNLPPNYNGAQEFYAWWKGLGDERRRAAERQARQVHHGEGPPLPHEELAAQRRRADDPRRDLRGPAGHAREPQRLRRPISTNAGQRRGERQRRRR